MNNLYLHDLEKGDIVGVDEAGRGPLAGNVVAAAVKIKNYIPEFKMIDDSKKLSEKRREYLYDLIMENCWVGVGEATPSEIDEINILNATFLAMRRALAELQAQGLELKKVLVDGNHRIREYSGEQEFIIKGDSISFAIAAASIVAKVTRDREMAEAGLKYPGYEFEKHKGYGTKRHREILLDKGSSPIHRKSFLKKILGDI